MIILDTTTRSLEVDLNGAVTTNQLPFVASYVDINQSTFAMSAMSSNTGASNNTTAVTLVAAPGATTSRVLKYLSIKNSDTVATLLWIQVNDNSTLREIWKGTLAVGDTLVYVDSLGFNVLNSSGQIKTGSGISSIGSSTDNALVRWDGTGGTAIQNSGSTLDDSGNLALAGNLVVSGTGPHGLGGAANATNQFTQSGTYTGSASTDNALFQIEATLNVSANAFGAGVRIVPTLVEAGSGTHPDFASLRVDAPTITGGAAVLTNASTLKITGAPTGATNNYALWVAGGNVKLDGAQILNAVGSATTPSYSFTQTVGTGMFATTGHVLGFAVGTIGEIVRFTAGGYFKASNSGTYHGATSSYHEVYNDSDTSSVVLNVKHAAATATNQNGIDILLTGDPNDTTRFMLRCVGNATERATIRSNGGFANYQANDVNLCDANAKTNISIAPDYTDQVERLVYKTFAYKESPDDETLDITAQDIEEFAPELVGEWSGGMKSVKTYRLQQRINSVVPRLIARIKALESRLN